MVEANQEIVRLHKANKELTTSVQKTKGKWDREIERALTAERKAAQQANQLVDLEAQLFTRGEELQSLKQQNSQLADSLNTMQHEVRMAQSRSAQVVADYEKKELEKDNAMKGMTLELTLVRSDLEMVRRQSGALEIEKRSLEAKIQTEGYSVRSLMDKTERVLKENEALNRQVRLQWADVTYHKKRCEQYLQDKQQLAATLEDQMRLSRNYPEEEHGTVPDRNIGPAPPQDSS